MESQIPEQSPVAYNLAVLDTRPDRSKTYDPPKPILDRLIVRRIEGDEETGFAIPKKYRQESGRGIVLAIGDGVELGKIWHEMSEFVKPGDIVKYGDYTSERLDKDDEETVVI